MTAPAREFTWTRAYGGVPAGSADLPVTNPRGWSEYPQSRQIRKMIYLLKEALLTQGWSVVGSCGWDGTDVTAGMDGVDRWIDMHAVTGTWTQTPHVGKMSWIVLRNTAINASGAGYQIYLATETNNTSATYPVIVIESYSVGFTGGSVTTRPTASDQRLLLSTLNSGFSDYADAARGFNILTSVDRSKVRILFSSNAMVTLHMWCFEKPQGMKTWWDKPCLSGYCEMLSYANLNETSTGLVVRAGDVIGIPVYLSADGFGTAGALGKQAMLGGADPNGNWMCSPVGIIGSCAQSIGYMGRLADAYWVHQNMANGDYYPNDGSRQWVVVGDIMHASDGGAVVLD
jgi:hypothetical protein